MWLAVGAVAILFLGTLSLMALIFGAAFLMRRRRPKLWDQLNQPLVAGGALAAAIAWVGHRLAPAKQEGIDEATAFLRAQNALKEKQEARRLLSGGDPPPNP